MNENKTKSIGVMYFSPTKTTAKICKAIASGMGEDVPVELNITKPDFRKKLISNPEALLNGIDHLIVGAPVYTGKLPLQVIESLNIMVGEGKECTVVVVYGNRDYGVAFRNMTEILIRRGFKIIAAGAFIGQHSYSDIIPVAMGRPDITDLGKAKIFGANSINTSKYLSPEDIPVQLDMFSKSKKHYPLKPFFISEKCTQCGICSETCPVGIISPETGDYINKKAKDLCIGCMACVRNCKNEAKIAKPDFIMKLMMKQILKKASVQRLEPLLIFP